MNEFARQKLTELVARYGRDLCLDARKSENLLRDTCPDHKREISALAAAAREQVAGDLLRTSTGVPIEAMLTRLSKRLHENQGLTEGLARWAVESWAFALGVVGAAQLTPVDELQPSRARDDEANAEQFRHAVRMAAADGTVQQEEVDLLNALRRRLSLDKTVAKQIFAEETKRVAKAASRSSAQIDESRRPASAQLSAPLVASPPTFAVVPPPIYHASGSGAPPAPVVPPFPATYAQPVYASPPAPIPMPVKERLRVPSLVLLVTGTLGGGASFLATLGGLFAGMGGVEDLFIGGFYALVAAANVFVAFAAFNMMHLRNYQIAFIGSVLAIVPCIGCGLLTVPFGVWAMVLLSKPEVKSSFH